MASKSSTLGSLIRLVRKKNSWTLRQLSEKVGIPLSTLAKVETDKLSLTYDKLQQFTASLGLSMTEFLAQGELPAASAIPVLTARRSLTNSGNSIRISTPNYDYEYLCADLRQKRMVPILTRIRSKDIAEFGVLFDGHRGRGGRPVTVLRDNAAGAREHEKRWNQRQQ